MVIADVSVPWSLVDDEPTRRRRRRQCRHSPSPHRGGVSEHISRRRKHLYRRCWAVNAISTTGQATCFPVGGI